jgi:hypothetical protein
MQQCRYLSDAVDAATHAGLASSLLRHVQLASNAKRHNVSPAQVPVAGGWRSNVLLSKVPSVLSHVLTAERVWD